MNFFKNIKGKLQQQTSRTNSSLGEQIGKLKTQKDFTGLIGLIMGSENRETQRQAAVALLEIDPLGSNHAIQEIIDNLRNENEQVRISTIVILNAIGEAAIEPLVTSLVRGDQSFCNSIMTALMYMKENGIPQGLLVDALINGLQANAPIARKVAVIVLGSLKDARTIAPLIKMTYDEDFGVRGKAAEALEWLQAPDTEVKKLLDTLDTLDYDTVNFNETPEKVKLLLASASMYTDLHPESKEFFIRRALKLAISLERRERIRAYYIASAWANEDARIDKTLQEVNVH